VYAVKAAAPERYFDRNEFEEIFRTLNRS